MKTKSRLFATTGRPLVALLVFNDPHREFEARYVHTSPLDPLPADAVRKRQKARDLREKAIEAASAVDQGPLQ